MKHIHSICLSGNGMASCYPGCGCLVVHTLLNLFRRFGLLGGLGFLFFLWAIGAIYGFQRAIGNRGFWNIDYGPAMYFYSQGTSFGIVGDLGLGFAIAKSKN